VGDDSRHDPSDDGSRRANSSTPFAALDSAARRGETHPRPGGARVTPTASILYAGRRHAAPPRTGEVARIALSGSPRPDPPGRRRRMDGPSGSWVTPAHAVDLVSVGVELLQVGAAGDLPPPQERN